jgi:hypothetical protein
MAHVYIQLLARLHADLRIRFTLAAEASLV